MAEERVIEVGDDRRPAVVDLLVSAFHGYEAMVYMLGGADMARLPALVGYFVDQRLDGEGLVLGVESGRGALAAVALVDPPGASRPPGFPTLREVMGFDVEARAHSFSDAAELLEPEVPVFYVGMLGVLDEYRGRGYSRLLMERVAELSRSDPDSHGLLLTTEHEENLGIYRSLGFHLLGDAVTEDGGLRTWILYRADP